MSDKKQSAVEWLEDMMMINGFIIPLTLFEQARQMEKEQIKKAYQGNWPEILSDESEEYYNETYGKE